MRHEMVPGHLIATRGTGPERDLSSSAYFRRVIRRHVQSGRADIARRQRWRQIPTATGPLANSRRRWTCTRSSRLRTVRGSSAKTVHARNRQR